MATREHVQAQLMELAKEMNRNGDKSPSLIAGLNLLDVFMTIQLDIVDKLEQIRAELDQIQLNTSD
jgi:hypothetical protein